MGKAQPKDHQRPTKKPVQRTIYFGGDLELQDELSEARKQLRQLEVLNRDPERIVAAREEVRRLKAAVQEDSLKIVVRSIGRKKYDKLMEAHPPTEKLIAEMRAEWEKTPEEERRRFEEPAFNPDTFPQALIEACLEEYDSEDVEEMFEGDDWSSGEITALFQTCVEVNNRSNLVQLGKD